MSLSENIENKTSGRSLLKVVLVALFAALISAGSFITIPLPLVPIVLQNLFTLLAGLILGPFLGTCAVAVFLVEGALGLPVFAGAKGGLAVILGPTGGFLIGYLISALITGLIAARPRPAIKTPLWRLSIAATVGAVIVFIPGVIQLAFHLGWNWNKALAVGLLPFIVGDIVKIAIAIAIAPRLRKTVAELLDA